MTELAVYASPLPFSGHKTLVKALPGSTLRQIVNNIKPHDYRAAALGAIVTINGEVIPPQYWDRIRPKEGALVNVQIVPQGGIGGGGGGKSPLATVLSIAVMVAAPYVGSYAAFSLAGGMGPLTAGQLLFGKVVSAAFGIVGKLAVSALVAPPKPSNVGTAGASISSPAESPTQFIEGARNSLNPFGVVPVCLGTNRMFPLQASRPYTETVGSDQFVRQLFTWGYGAEIELSELKIGETLLTEFTDVETEHKLAGDLSDGTALFANDPYQNDLNILLAYDDGYSTRTTQLDADEAIIDITFPQGLFALADDGAGGRVSWTVGLQIDYAPTGTGSWTTAYAATITEKHSEVLRKAYRIIFPSNGQYDIRVKRTTNDTTVDYRFDQFYWTSLKSFTYRNPVNLAGINGTALRMKASDQLNGAVDQLNAIVSNHIPDYDIDTDTWITRATSNPASIYRYVLQGLPNSKRLADSKINIDDLEDWHSHCVSKGYTYNRVIDYETSVDEVLRDVATAGAATPAIVDGKRTVAIDRVQDDVVQIITPRNSWGYQGEMIYPSIPHALRVQFRNKDSGYGQDERIVYADGYDENTATDFEVLDWQSCTNADLAFKAGRRTLANAILRPETHVFMMDFEHLRALRGNRIKLVHDVPVVGVGDGRIKSVMTDGNSPALVTGFTIDDTVTFPTAGTYYTRIRLADGTQLYKEITVSIGATSTLTFATPFSIDNSPAAGDLCYFVEAGGELDLIITRIDPMDDLTAKITAQDYAQPGIDDSESTAIPTFNSKVTTPLEFIRPIAPVLVDSQSDENVMLLNSDGSYTSRAVFTLENLNDPGVNVEVKIRPSGTTAFAAAQILEAAPERVSITGMDDGALYDIRIRYKRNNSGLYSKALEINNYLFEGASAVPAAVTGFIINVVGESAILKWDKNTELDIAYYTIKYSPLYSGAAWNTALILEEKIYELRLQTLFRGGTYLIKAVDYLGNESATATAIITYNPGQIANAEAELIENPDFTGTHDNTEVYNNHLVLSGTDADGYYYFSDIVNLDAVFPCIVTASVTASGTYVNNIFDMDDIFSESDIFGEGGNNLFAIDDIFATDDIFGIGTDSWAVELQYSITQTDPDNSPAEWGDWTRLDAGIIEFYAIRFRLKLSSTAANISPSVSALSVNVDMPDRIERGEDLTVSAAGSSVVFTPEFRVTPAIAITIQDGEVDDRIEYTAKTAGGFTFKVYNETQGDYVERSYDYIASGYGRKNS